MRQLAATLRSWADAIGAEAARAGGAVASMPFEGPAATRLRTSASDWRSGGQAVANTLNDLAADLVRGAAEVEAEQRALEQRLRQEAEK
jgi:hypothetical protein